ncbi:MAG: hypothetical protein HY526_08595 [Betaproteobacteria bacterium]|nr:hypothetical protein [Betaproteobacteria bacterium]
MQFTPYHTKYFAYELTRRYPPDSVEYFDDEVREKLKLRDEDSKAYLNRFERLL